MRAQPLSFRPKTIVIPTGASLSRREREAEWRDLAFPEIVMFLKTLTRSSRERYR